MIRSILTSLTLLAGILSAYSQFPSWRIKANNDTIYIMDGTSIIRGDRKGKTTVWDLDGRQLYSTDDRLNRFHDGRATVLNKDSWEIIGCLDPEGKFIPIPHMAVAYSHPHFENGFLIGKRKGKFAMFSKDGDEQILPELVSLYPFSNGYAVYMAYENPEKQKKPFFNYIKADGTPLKGFVVKEKDKEKEIEPKNITFLSSVDSNGRGIAIFKNKLYWFNASDESLIPVLMGDEAEKKRHLTLVEDKELDFTAIADANLKFAAKYGKDQLENFEFDRRLRLLTQGRTSEDKSDEAAYPAKAMKTILSTYAERHLQGLVYDGTDSIPAQFEQTGLLYDNKAFVKSKGKWGVLEISPDVSIDINLNGGDPITFRHQKFPTRLHIELPCSIASKGIRTDIEELPRFSIDLDSRENRDTRTGNYIDYNCVLSVPTDLGDSLATITYGPLELLHDNIRLHPVYVKAKARYATPYSIEVSGKDVAVDKGCSAFDISVGIDKGEDEEEYPYEISVSSEALMSRIEKVSDNIYRCFVDYIDEGIHDLDILLTESWCPTRVFPAELVSSKKGKASVRLLLPESPVDNDSIAAIQGSADAGVRKGQGARKSTGMTPTLRKAPLFVKYPDGYILGEVTAQEPAIFSGPGEDFPVPTYAIEDLGRQEIPAPYSGQLIKVKDEGEWWRKHPGIPASQTPQPEFISKKSVRPVRSTPFSLKDITEPIIYVSTQDIFDEANNKTQYTDEVITYPGGLCIEYSERKDGAQIKFGNIADGKPAVEWKYRIQTSGGDPGNEGSETKVTIDNSKSMHRLRLTVAPQDRKTVTKSKKEMAYADLSAIGADQWLDILKDYLLTADAAYDRHEVTEYECDVITKDMLENNFIKAEK